MTTRVAIALLCANWAIAQDRPRALEAFEQARKAIISGRVEWAAIPNGDDSKAMNFVSRFARNGDLIVENCGDKDGFTLFEPSTGKGNRRFPQAYLQNADGIWHYEETLPDCRWWAPDGEPMQGREQYLRDIRALGISSSSWSLEAGLGLLWENQGQALGGWHEVNEGDYYIVSGQYHSGVKVTWFLNAAKGWNAERVAVEYGTSLREAVMSLKQYGEVWFPESARFYKDGELTDEVVVKSAELNKPSDPARFTPTDIGIEAGSFVSCQNKKLPSGPDQNYWAGDRFMPARQFWKEVFAGQREIGPTIKAHQNPNYRSPYLTEEDIRQGQAAKRAFEIRRAVNRPEELWERFVRSFIYRFKLNDDQAQRAWTIYLDCRQRADSIIARHKDELLPLVSEQLSAQDAGKTEQAEKLKERVDRLMAPVEKIFSEQLVPRLEKLPTRAQRAAVENPPTSAPGKP